MAPPAMTAPALLVDARDNVATAIAALAAGARVAVASGATRREIAVRDDIPYGHKIAVADIPAGADVLKYGEVIGRAARDIAAGEHVHVHNVDSLRAQAGAAREV